MAGKIVLILVTAVVYTVAWYGKLWSAHPAYEYGAPVAARAAPPKSVAQPMYEEGFVDLYTEGTVSHVSTLAPLDNGRVMAAWYSGSREGARDVKIYTSVYDPEGRSWSLERAVVSRESASRELGRYIKKVGNPVLFTDTEARLWLVYVTVSAGGWSGSSLNYKLSLDNGKSWSGSKKLITGPLFNISTLVKNRPVQLNNGALLLPVYHELLYKFPEVLFLTPSDTGLYARNRRAATVPGALQGALLVTANGGLRAFYRNATGGGRNHVLTSKSEDNGMTWSEPVETALPNPNSGLDVAGGGDGRAIMVLNDTFGSRSRLTLYSSLDYGATWFKVKVLEESEGGEFSYPSIVRSPQGVYHVTYTYDRQRIKHITFTEEWLKSARNGQNH